MYRSLDAGKIIQTIGQLRDRIQERFPESGLSKVAEELLQVSHEAVKRAEWIEKPNIPLRVGVGLLIALFFGVLIGIFSTFKLNTGFRDFSDFIQAMDAGVNVVILIGAGILYLVNLEIRIKRKHALRMIHELRALAHIVDVHQLTKDPERMLHPGSNTASSPVRSMTAFELSRYLDYSSEMLSLIGKIGALYAQHFDDAVVLEAVDDIEDLTVGLSRKIWQKIGIGNQGD